MPWFLIASFVFVCWLVLMVIEWYFSPDYMDPLDSWTDAAVVAIVQTLLGIVLGYFTAHISF